MDGLSVLAKMSLAGMVVFGILWYRTSPESVYETVELEMVSTKKVFLIITLVCFGLFLASFFSLR